MSGESGPFYGGDQGAYYGEPVRVADRILARSADSTEPKTVTEALKEFPKLGRWILLDFQRELEAGRSEAEILAGITKYYHYDELPHFGVSRIINLGREATTAMVQRGYDPAAPPLSDWVSTFGVNKKPKESKKPKGSKKHPAKSAPQAKKKTAIEPLPPGAEKELVAWSGGLTERQAKILALLSEGLSISDIAEDLSFTRQTISVDLNNIYYAFGLAGTANRTKKAEALAMAREIVAQISSEDVE